LESWDERVQANNLYLEVLADLGVIGFAAFLWLILAPLAGAVRALRGGGAYWALGVGLGVVAFLVHGLLDSFLAFTPTALLFWIFLGCLGAQKPHVSGRW
jgi:O-antigen ligase